jgi:hypothetical protein
MRRRRNLNTRASALAVAVTTLCAANAQAQTAKEKELEARIEQLERQIKGTTAAQPAAAPAAPTVQSKAIAPNALPNTRFFFSGFIKLDGMVSDYDDGEIADGSVGRSTYRGPFPSVASVRIPISICMRSSRDSFSARIRISLTRAS